MARQEITVQDLDRAASLDAAYDAGHADGHSFVNDGRQIVHVKNGSGAPVDVTIPTPALSSGLAIADLVVTVAATDEAFIGKLPPALFNQSTGVVHIDLSLETSVTLAVINPV